MHRVYAAAAAYDLAFSHGRDYAREVSRGEVQDETLGFEVSAADYMTKPVSPPVTLGRVQLHLELQRTRRAEEAERHPRGDVLLPADWQAGYGSALLYAVSGDDTVRGVAERVGD